MIGKIYKIVHSQSDIIYVGSTFNDLYKRFYMHKHASNRCCIGKLIREHGVDQFKIMLIKEYEVVDKKHLIAYEQLWINKLKCINESSAFTIWHIYFKHYRKINCQSIKEKRKIHYEQHKEEYSKRAKQYREKNKDKIREQINQRRLVKSTGDNREQYLASKKEEYQRHKEKYSESSKLYRERNKEKLQARRREMIHCDVCNCDITRSSLPKHRKSPKHLNNI